MKSPYKELAKRFMPNGIRYLLIGESPPYTPPDEELKYFYNYENSKNGQILLSSVSYSVLGQKFYVDRDDKKDFLNRLMKQNLFLLDATYEPINHIKNKKLRRFKITNVYPQLKRDINKVPLKKEARILLIHGNVIKTIGRTIREDFKSHRFYDIGFPRYYNDERFKERIQEAIDE
jgi:hypothetical protein